MSALDVLEPTFMLLPNFTYMPDGPLQLGSIIPRSKETKRPDPRRLLNRSTLSPPSETTEQIFEPWSWDSEEEHSRNAGVFAEVSMLTGVGGRFEGNRTRLNRFKIRCDKATQKIFCPDDTYVLQAIEGPDIQTILKKSQRPTIFLVTGIMVAHGASIAVQPSLGASLGLKVTADATPLGVPLAAGGDIGFANIASSKLENVPTEPFILAYQLRRIRRKFFSDSTTEGDENTWALFDDAGIGDEERLQSFKDTCEMDSVTPDTIWED